MLPAGCYSGTAQVMSCVLSIVAPLPPRLSDLKHGRFHLYMYVLLGKHPEYYKWVTAVNLSDKCKLCLVSKKVPVSLDLGICQRS